MASGHLSGRCQGADRQCSRRSATAYGLLPGQLGSTCETGGVFPFETSEGCIPACDACYGDCSVYVGRLGFGRITAASIHRTTGSLRDSSQAGRWRSSCASGGRAFCPFGLFPQGRTWKTFRCSMALPLCVPFWRVLWQPPTPGSLLQ